MFPFFALPLELCLAISRSFMAHRDLLNFYKALFTDKTLYRYAHRDLLFQIQKIYHFEESLIRHLKVNTTLMYLFEFARYAQTLPLHVLFNAALLHETRPSQIEHIINELADDHAFVDYDINDILISLFISNQHGFTRNAKCIINIMMKYGNLATQEKILHIALIGQWNDEDESEDELIEPNLTVVTLLVPTHFPVNYAYVSYLVLNEDGVYNDPYYEENHDHDIEYTLKHPITWHLLQSCNVFEMGMPQSPKRALHEAVTHYLLEDVPDGRLEVEKVMQTYIDTNQCCAWENKTKEGNGSVESS